MTAQVRPTVEQVWAWLDEVYDPEIPVISVVDLGIVRDVRWDDGDGAAGAANAAGAGDDKGACNTPLRVTITPTYSGCPATQVIARDIEQALRDHGIASPRVEWRIAPPWTTDWISEKGKKALAEYGIAPPAPRAPAVLSILRRRGAESSPAGGPSGAGQMVRSSQPAAVPCPRCGSTDTTRVSQFGSTPCKAHYTCRACLEPFDYFKCI